MKLTDPKWHPRPSKRRFSPKDRKTLAPSQSAIELAHILNLKRDGPSVFAKAAWVSRLDFAKKIGSKFASGSDVQHVDDAVGRRQPKPSGRCASSPG